MTSLSIPTHPCGPTSWQCSELIEAYTELLAARTDAQERRMKAEANAVPISQLRARGCGEAILLWLLYQGHVEHLQPALRRGVAHQPRPVNSVRLLETS